MTVDQVGVDLTIGLGDGCPHRRRMKRSVSSGHGSFHSSPLRAVFLILFTAVAHLLYIFSSFKFKWKQERSFTLLLSLIFLPSSIFRRHCCFCPRCCCCLRYHYPHLHCPCSFGPSIVHTSPTCWPLIWSMACSVWLAHILPSSSFSHSPLLYSPSVVNKKIWDFSKKVLWQMIPLKTDAAKSFSPHPPPPPREAWKEAEPRQLAPLCHPPWCTKDLLSPLDKSRCLPKFPVNRKLRQS